MSKYSDYLDEVDKQRKISMAADALSVLIVVTGLIYLLFIC